MTNKIYDAVRQLDINNDNHWTTDGLPRLDTVKMLAGDPTLTREKVEESVPGFKRTTAEAYVLPDDAPRDAEEPASAPSGQTVDQASTPAEGSEGSMPPEIAQGVTGQGANLFATPESDLRDAVASTAPAPTAPRSLGGPNDDPFPGSEDGASEAQLGTLENGASGNPDVLEALEAELEEAEAYSEKLKEAADKVAEELAKSVAHESALRARIEAARPRNGVMPAIQSYFAAQDAAADNVAAMRQAIADSGLDLGKIQNLIGPAAVDRAAAQANK